MHRGSDAGKAAAEMVLVGFVGTEPHEAMRALGEVAWGGVILFSRNVRNPRQLRRLTQGLRRRWRELGAQLPPLIAVDQEGGRVARLRTGATRFPGAMALGATADDCLARAQGRATARELRAVGANLNLAPVLDVNSMLSNPVIGTRSLGADPESVARLGVAFIRGHQEQGVAATAKHFPGHGDTDRDSHRELPVVEADEPTLWKRELLPFRRAVAEGVAVVMTAHVVFKALDPVLPATLSPRVIDGLLRDRLGYHGVVVTDCMEMRAIADRYDPEEAAVLAIEAGCDAVLVSHSPQFQHRSWRGLVRAINEGRLTERRVAQSLDRLRRLRRLWGEPAPLPMAVVGCDEHQQLALEIARASLTVVRDPRGLIPLQPATVLLAWVDLDSGAADGGRDLSFWLREAGFQVTGPSRDQPTLPPARQVVVLVTVDGPLVSERHGHEWSRIQRWQLPTIVISTGVPFGLGEVPGHWSVVAAYGAEPCTLMALAELLAGRVSHRGRLPVPIPRE